MTSDTMKRESPSFIPKTSLTKLHLPVYGFIKYWNHILKIARIRIFSKISLFLIKQTMKKNSVRLPLTESGLECILALLLSLKIKAERRTEKFS